MEIRPEVCGGKCLRNMCSTPQKQPAAKVACSVGGRVPGGGLVVVGGGEGEEEEEGTMDIWVDAVKGRRRRDRKVGTICCCFVSLLSLSLAAAVGGQDEYVSREGDLNCYSAMMIAYRAVRLERTRSQSDDYIHLSQRQWLRIN